MNISQWRLLSGWKNYGVEPPVSHPRIFGGENSQPKSSVTDFVAGPGGRFCPEHLDRRDSSSQALMHLGAEFNLSDSINKIEVNPHYIRYFRLF